VPGPQNSLEILPESMEYYGIITTTYLLVYGQYYYGSAGIKKR
jgi:hypothetical protein